MTFRDQYEQQASTLLDSIASSSRSGLDPNPELIYDALQTQSTQAVSQAALSGDPVLDDVITEPAPNNGKSGSMSQSPDSVSAYAKVDPKTWWQVYHQAQKGYDPEQRKQFESVGGVPVPDQRYLDGVLYWTKNDPNQARNWKTLLNNTNSYIKLYPGPERVGSEKVDVSKPWNDHDTQMLKLYLRNWALPAAIKGQDPNYRAGAATLLRNIDTEMGFPEEDLDKLSDRAKKDQKFNSDMAIGWVMSHPDQKIQNHLMTLYMDSFGDQGLADGLKKLGDQSFGGGLLSTVNELANGTIFLPLSTMERHQHSQATAALDEATMRRDLELSPDQLHALIQAAQVAHDSRSWLSPVQHGLQQAGTILALTATWLNAPVWDGHLNVADNFTHGFQNAWANRDNLVAGVVGKKLADQHQDLSDIGNTLGMLLFDPTNLLGPVGRAATLGRTLGTVERIAGLDRAALMANRGLKSTLSQKALDRLQYAFNPEPFMSQLRRDTILPVFRGPDMLFHDRVKLLGLADGDSMVDTLKSIHRDDGTLLQKTQAGTLIDDQFIDDLFMRDWLGKVDVGGTYYNYQSHLRAVQPEIQRRLDAGGVQRMMQMAGMHLGSTAFELGDHGVIETADSIMRYAHAVAGRKFDLADKAKEVANRMLMAPAHERQDIVADFVDGMADKLPKGFFEWLEERKALNQSRWLGQIVGKKTPKQTYAIEFDVNKPAIERSVVPRRLDEKVQHFVDGAQQQIDALDQRYEQTIEKWFRDRYLLSVGPGEEEAAKFAFEKDPKNLGVTQEWERARARWQERIDFWAPLGTQRGGPMFPGQLNSHFIMPYSISDILTYNNPILRNLATNRIASLYNSAMTLWKVWEIAKPSTAFRAALGDDIIRWSTDLAQWGSPRAAAQALVHRSLSKQATFVPDLVGSVFGGMRSGIKALSAQDAELAQKILDQGFGFNLLDMLGETVPRDWGYLEPAAGLEGRMHREALTRVLNHTYNAQFSRDWARAYDEQGADAARQAIREYYERPGKQPAAMRTARGFTQAQAQEAVARHQHAEMAADIRKRIAELEAKHPVFLRGPRRGQPNIPASEWRALYGGLPKRMKGGISLTGLRGKYKDRVEARLQYHDDRAHALKGTKPVEDTVDQTHDFLEGFFRNKTLRQMFAKGKVQQDVLEKLYEDPISRSELPRVIAPMDGLEFAHTGVRGPYHRAQIMADRTIGRMIQGARADGAERLRQWQEDYLTARFGGQEGWTKERIEKDAIAFARQYMKNNVYMGTRTLADVAMNKIFPFSGAALSFDRFLLKQIRSHPWIVGPMMDVDQWVRDKRNDPHYGGIDLNPLSWFGISGGMHMYIHPENILFFGGEGFGSTMPGLPPLLSSLTSLLSQDSWARDLLNEVPGWSDWLPPAGSSVMESLHYALPTWIRKGEQALEEVAGTPPQLSGEQATYTRIAREFQAEQGRAPTDREVTDIAAAQSGLQALTSWLVPFSPNFADPVGSQVDKAKRELGQASTREERDAVITKYPDIKELLVSIDPKLTAQQVGKIETAHPEIIPYRTSLYQNAPGLEFDVPEAGLPYQEVGPYNQAVKQERENAVGWALLRDAKSKLSKWQADNPWATPRSQEYQDFHTKEIQPYYDKMASGPLRDFYEKYVAQIPKSDLLTKEVNSSPISMLSAFYGLPSLGEYNDERANGIRQILAMRDDVASRIAEIRSYRGDPNDINKAVDQFHQRILQIMDNDPELEAEMNLFHWSSWRDFIDVKTLQLEKEARGGY